MTGERTQSDRQDKHSRTVPAGKDSTMYHHIVFDIDGTLINTEEVCLKSMQRLILSRQNREVTLEECRFSLGIPSHRVLPMIGMESSDEILAEWDSYYADLIDSAKPFDGIIELLDALKQCGVKLGIVTSRSGTEMEYDPNMKLLLPYFEVVITASDTTEHKPSPAPLLEYLRRTGAQAEDALYIGDTIYDCQCAKGAGVAFALATWGAVPCEGMQADYHPSKPLELLDLAAKS
ncbi:HAD-IA family hydrolase [Hydrogenoanaerobacterium sp.]|uniref:HAD family hydrolase n=1 Tax=Hydrogenoanaerobacterium sp. TaxID=2953763 RepID=UPI00289DA28F|nr:HAD-IA family hydrolase [Hydrogenoanaerobacterium sp.]